MWFAAFSVVGLLVAFAALAWWAKRQGVDIQASLDKVTALQTDAVIKEKSNEVVAAATAARVNAGSYADERLSTTPLPADAYRD